MPRRDPGKLLILAGFFTWAMIGVPYVAAMISSPSARHAGTFTWLGAHLTFAALLGMSLRARRADEVETGTPQHRLILLLQVVAAWTAVAATGDGLVMILLVIIAGQVPFSNPLRISLIWIGTQTAIAAPLALHDQALGRAVVEAGTQLGFQLFAVYASTAAVREQRARAMLTRVNAELLSTRELLANSSRLAERRRISRELHDLMGHHLTALSLQLEAAGHRADGELAEQIRGARGIAAELLQDVRQVVRTFRTDNSVDLAGPLRTLVQALPRPRIHLDLPAALEVGDPVRANAVLRSVQEIVTNTARHAHAENLWIALQRSKKSLDVRAHDDGRGARSLQLGHGLTGLRERLEELGGSLELETSFGQGFRVNAQLPLRETPS